METKKLENMTIAEYCSVYNKRNKIYKEYVETYSQLSEEIISVTNGAEFRKALGKLVAQYFKVHYPPENNRKGVRIDGDEYRYEEGRIEKREFRCKLYHEVRMFDYRASGLSKDIFRPFVNEGKFYSFLLAMDKIYSEVSEKLSFEREVTLTTALSKSHVVLFEDKFYNSEPSNIKEKEVDLLTTKIISLRTNRSYRDIVREYEVEKSLNLGGNEREFLIDDDYFKDILHHLGLVNQKQEQLISEYQKVLDTALEQLNNSEYSMYLVAGEL